MRSFAGTSSGAPVVLVEGAGVGCTVVIAGRAEDRLVCRLDGRFVVRPAARVAGFGAGFSEPPAGFSGWNSVQTGRCTPGSIGVKPPSIVGSDGGGFGRAMRCFWKTGFLRDCGGGV